MEKKKDFRLGHRGRVKDRFLREGLSPFVDYEVLELLLFFVIPRRDTKEMAHALIHRFSSLNGVLQASEEELCQIAGIGVRTAAFLRGLLPFAARAVMPDEADEKTDSISALVTSFATYFSQDRNARVLVAYLNNRMELLEIKDLGVERFTSVSVLAKNLIPDAFACRASFVALAYTTNQVIPFPTFDAMGAARDVERELSLVGLTLVDTYLITSGGVCSIKKVEKGKTTKDDMPSVDLTKDPKTVKEEERFFLCSILTSFMSDEKAREAAEELLRERSLRTLFSLPYKKLMEIYPEKAQAVFFIQVLGSLLSYANTEKARLTHPVLSTAKEMGEMFCAVLRGRRNEIFCIAILDQNHRLTGLYFVGNGTVNGAAVTSRALLELAAAHDAYTVVMAHNHPFGDIKPSSYDVQLTKEVIEGFRSVGIRFLEHFVVNEKDYTLIAREYLRIPTDAWENFYRGEEREF